MNSLYSTGPFQPTHDQLGNLLSTLSSKVGTALGPQVDKTVPLLVGTETDLPQILSVGPIEVKPPVVLAVWPRRGSRPAGAHSSARSSADAGRPQRMSLWKNSLRTVKVPRKALMMSES